MKRMIKILEHILAGTYPIEDDMVKVDAFNQIISNMMFKVFRPVKRKLQSNFAKEHWFYNRWTLL
jgi:hypothetical protein